MLKLRLEWKSVKEGSKFNRITVLGPQFQLSDSRGKRRWYCVCRCDCGIVSVIGPAILRRKSHPSRVCRCLSKNSVEYGGAKTPLYGVYWGMIRRCYDENAAGYKNYGGRGITVCEEWIASFEAFRDWALSHGYKPGLQIDREKNDLGYSPDNCRFVTAKVNSNNKRNTLFFALKNETKSLSQWADDPRCSVTYMTLRDRLRRGWDFQKALTTAAIR